MIGEFVKMHGLEESVAALHAVPPAILKGRHSPIRKATFAAALVIKEDAIERAPVGEDTPDPGNLKRNIYIFRERNPQGAIERYGVQVRTGRKRRSKFRLGIGARSALRNFSGGSAYYWHMVEFGTSKQRGQRFMTKAFETKGRAALTAFENALKQGVDEVSEQIHRKVGR